MKNLRHMLIGVGCLVALACGGGRSVDPAPSGVAAGDQAISEGVYWFERGCAHSARRYFRMALEAYTLADHLSGVARSLNNLGSVYRSLGDADAAEQFFDEAASTYQRLQDPDGTLHALTNKVAVLIDRRALVEAGERIEQARRIESQTGRRFLPLAKITAVWHSRNGRYDEAEKILRELLDGPGATDHRLKAGTRYTLGRLLVDTGRYSEALPHLHDALTLDREIGNFNGIAEDLAALGEVFVHLGRDADAVFYFDRSAQIYALLGRDREARDMLDAAHEVPGGSGDGQRLTQQFAESWLRGEKETSLCP